MLVVFLVVPNGLAFYLWNLANQESAKAALVQSGPAQFISERPFVAEGVLGSPSMNSLTSKHFLEPCLAYHLKVDLMRTQRDSDGELEDRRSNLLEERHQVPDLTVKFPSGEGLLDIEILSSFYHSKYDELDSLPDYIDAEKVPKLNAEGKPWYEVFEHTFVEGQSVTVVGSLNPRGVLEAHPGAKELIVFPGNTAECATALQQSSRSYKYITYGLIAMSVFASLLLMFILKFMKK
jgi:hypothetical protein